MRPGQMTPQLRKFSAARMPKQPSASVRRRLKSNTHSNLLYRLLVPRRGSKWLSTFAQSFAMAMIRNCQAPMFALMQTSLAKLADDRGNSPWGLVQMQTNTSELLVPTSLPRQMEIDYRCNIQEQNGFTDKAVTWMLAPVFFCCVMVEKAKPPQTWEATEIFSQVIVSFMLKLFVLATDLNGGEQQKLKEGNKN